MEDFHKSLLKLLRTGKFNLARVLFENADPASNFDRYDMTVACSAATDGFTLAMEYGGADLKRELAKVPIDVAGFAVEGAVLAIGASCKLDEDWQRLSDFVAGCSEHQINAVSGCGGAFAHAGLSLSSIPADVSPFWRWLLVDAYSFHQAFFNAHRVIVNREIPEMRFDWERRAYNQGIGRAIWYATSGRPEAIKELINQFAPWQRGDMWYGVGLQAGYCGGIEKEFHQLRRYANKQLDGLTAGVVMAVMSRAGCGYYPDHTRHATEVILQAPTEKVVELFQQTLQQLHDQKDKPDMFLSVRNGLAKSILE
jgi:hypothetical protein